MTATTERIHAGGRALDIGNPTKPLFDDPTVTKRDLVEHYVRVAGVMLPHIRERPLALQRFPDGIAAGGFMQKQRPEYAPDWVTGVEVARETGGAITMVVCSDAATLAWLADQAAVTVHRWLSRTGDLRRPDRLIFDLDPSGEDFTAVRRAATDLHTLLDELGLPAYLMTTGSRGLHVVVPIRADEGFDDVRAFAGDVAGALAARHPDRLTTEVRKNQRKGRLFVDTLRNAYAQHAVAPYAVRPLPGAPVATPMTWDELKETRDARRWTIADMQNRLRGADPWGDMARHAHTLGPARDRLRS